MSALSTRSASSNAKRGPRFGIKLQVGLLGLGLLFIPVVALQYWEQIQQTTLDAQARIQETEARAIATSLIATQPNIRSLLAAETLNNVQSHALGAPELNRPIRLDGQYGDWPRNLQIEPAYPYDDPIWLADPETATELAFSLRLAQSNQHLYVALAVRDGKVVTRRPEHLRLDLADHVQLTYYDAMGGLQRVLIPVEKEGALASYYTDAKWQFGRDRIDPRDDSDIPSHKTGIQGVWKRTNEGYAMEFRLPLASFDAEQPRIHFAVVDVDDNPLYGPSAIVATLPEGLDDQLNPVSLDARELQRVIDAFKSAYARLAIYDQRGREWAYAAREQSASYSAYDLQTPLDTDCVKQALTGQIEPVRQLTNPAGEVQRLVVCYPIIDQGETLGVVLIDESARHVLSANRTRMQELALQLALITGGVLTVLVLYAFVLVRRIARLSQEARHSVDNQGRIAHAQLNSSRQFPDELGDLSRTLSSLLQSQQSYVQFLERIPQTLRHEISNPLNKLRTSLENLLDEQEQLGDNPYVQKMDKGIEQIHRITLQLTEATSLETAMQHEELAALDLTAFLRDYLSLASERIEVLIDPEQRVMIEADSSRLEQLFDKLLDNALSYCSEGGHVSVSLHREAKHVVVSINNDGPPLPTENIQELCAPMISTRSTGDTIHLGLGLHIAKLICDKHRAELTARNRDDHRGVVFSVRFKVVGKD